MTISNLFIIHLLKGPAVSAASFRISLSVVRAPPDTSSGKPIYPVTCSQQHKKTVPIVGYCLSWYLH